MNDKRKRVLLRSCIRLLQLHKTADLRMPQNHGYHAIYFYEEDFRYEFDLQYLGIEWQFSVSRLGADEKPFFGHKGTTLPTHKDLEAVISKAVEAASEAASEVA